MSNCRILHPLFVALALASLAPGCRIYRPYSDCPGPVGPVYPTSPRELQKVSLPDYTIEPPDVLTIDAISLVPRSPYLLRPLDVVVVQASGLPEDNQLPADAGEYQVGIDGTIVLGAGYDVVRDADKTEHYEPLHVAGMTVGEARDAIQARLATLARQPQTWVRLVSIGSQQEIAGEHLVAPDGTVNLGAYGRVRVVGMTLDQAKFAIEARLSSRFDNPEVAVDVFGYNSKVYYVVTQGAGLGDQIAQFPITGGDTALDAISQIQGLNASSSTRMWIARPGKNCADGDQIMPVDWLSITQRGDVTTNYQLMPGDRVYVAEDKLVALDTALAKFISPIERVFGITLLGTQTAKQVKFFNVVTGSNFNNF
ncbi:MAG: polysaccharide biosynthesis/export family protein [Planctomycetales bacterium]|nr:polysaccharide biosynthesis/export family protein [Planctomycetales bacterium]